MPVSVSSCLQLKQLKAKGEFDPSLPRPKLMTNCSQDIFQKNISTCLYVSFAREGGEEGGELHNLSSVRFTEFQSVPPNMVLF